MQNFIPFFKFCTCMWYRLLVHKYQTSMVHNHIYTYSPWPILLQSLVCNVHVLKCFVLSDCLYTFLDVWDPAWKNKFPRRSEIGNPTGNVRVTFPIAFLWGIGGWTNPGWFVCPGRVSPCLRHFLRKPGPWVGGLGSWRSQQALGEKIAYCH